jgi:purine-nucleoside phosphorylase
LPYENIPHYPKSTVKGHSGELVKGMLEEKEILVARGRAHCYEGYSRKTVTFPTCLLPIHLNVP